MLPQCCCYVNHPWKESKNNQKILQNGYVENFTPVKSAPNISPFTSQNYSSCYAMSATLHCKTTHIEASYQAYWKPIPAIQTPFLPHITKKEKASWDFPLCKYTKNCKRMQIEYELNWQLTRAFPQPLPRAEEKKSQAYCQRIRPFLHDDVVYRPAPSPAFCRSVHSFRDKALPNIREIPMPL